MNQKIFRLPEVVINQIAAGEVVEHPASVVKELVENSLDAGSTHISVSIWGGGLIRLEIEDNGFGMSPEDAALALERHATSKIRFVEDLFHLSTMGFRGEALAAIASISHFEVKTSDGVVGTLIQGKGGEIENTLLCARNQGTTISIQSLFYNVPARKKFQKSSSANVAQVTKVMETLSMAHPGVAFSYFSQGVKIFHLPVQDRKERVEAVLGSFAHVVQGEGIWGMFSAPQEAKSHRRGQFVFLNKRPVFSPLISKAVQMGYGTRLGEHMYPPFVLFLDVDPEEIDVNVHPQKKEVRIAQEQPLFQKIESSVAKMFMNSSSVSFASPLSFTEAPLPWSEISSEYPEIFEQTSFVLEVQEKPLIVMGPYLLMEKGGLKLVNLQAAYSRVLFEGLKKGKPSLQMLLEPWQLQGDEDLVTGLNKLGIECRLIGSRTMAIDALPQGMEQEEFQVFLESWKEEKRIDAAASRCCLHGKRQFSLEEAVDLWHQLKKCQDSLYDPLGKKIWITMQQADLEEWFTHFPSKG